MSPRSTRRFILVVLLVVILAIIAIFFFSHANKATMNTETKTINYTGLPVIGNPSSPNKILAIEDLKCHGCMVYNNLVYPQLKNDLINSGKATYHVLLVSFLPGSEPVANAAYCLNEQNSDYFFSFIHTVYANQPPESEDWATPATLIQFAKKSAPQANLIALSQCMLANRYEKQLKSNITYAARLMNNQLTTPTLYINGQPVTQPSASAVHTLIK